MTKKRNNGTRRAANQPPAVPIDNVRKDMEWAPEAEAPVELSPATRQTNQSILDEGFYVEIRPQKRRSSSATLLGMIVLAAVAIPITHTGRYGAASAANSTQVTSAAPTASAPLRFPSEVYASASKTPTTVKPASPGTDIAALREQANQLRTKRKYDALADTLELLGRQLIVSGQPLEAKPIVNELIALRRGRAKNALKLAAANHLLGWLELTGGDKTKAAAPLRSALKVREERRAPVADVAFTLQLLVWAEREAGNHPAAIAQARKLVALRRTGGDREQLASALDALGLSLIMGGQAGAAIPVLGEAVAAERGGPEGQVATSLYYLGWAILSSSSVPTERANAVAPLNEALAIRSRIAAPEAELAQILVLLGWAQREAGSYPEAIKSQTRVLAFSRTTGSPKSLIQSLEALAITNIQAGDPAAAVTLMVESVDLQSKAKDRIEKQAAAKSKYLLGWALYKDGKSEESSTMLQAALADQTELGLTADAELTSDLLKVVRP